MTPTAACSTYPACPICGEGQEIINPNNPLTGTPYSTCLEADNAGMAGEVTPSDCVTLQSVAPNDCGCRETGAPDTAEPTMAPTQNTVPPPPSTGDCTDESCAQLQNWGALGAFVQAAESGDMLCMCGHVFSNGLCGPPILMEEDKEIF